MNVLVGYFGEDVVNALNTHTHRACVPASRITEAVNSIHTPNNTSYM